ncbi:hypothetical protein APHAL10511_003896 [Amanita phalloides]|nr:hypothetical protein APHAL10511_003896 [Amanita phalloides]
MERPDTGQITQPSQDSVSWWAKIRGRTRKNNAQTEFDGVDEKDPKTLQNYVPDSKAGDEKEEEDDDDDDEYPDGGLKAWLVVLGGLLNTFSAFGFISSWGIFQAYYQHTILKDESPANIAWIASIQYALVLLPNILVGRLFDLGYFRSILVTSSIALVVATLLVAECKVYWQFLLCQGFAVGLACGGVFGPTTAVIAHWFKKRRGVAMAFIAMGSSFGGSLFPIAAKYLIPEVGFKWTMRIIAFILIFTLSISNLIMERRLPPKNLPGGLLNLAAFRSPAYTIYCMSAFVALLGLYTVQTYIAVAATDVPGLSGTLSFYLVSISNASGLLGRYASGVICDRYGPINTMVPSTILAATVTFIWPYVRTAHGLVGIAVVYGLCTGADISLMPIPLMNMGDTKDVGRRVGIHQSVGRVQGRWVVCGLDGFIRNGDDGCG